MFYKHLSSISLYLFYFLIFALSRLRSHPSISLALVCSMPLTVQPIRFISFYLLYVALVYSMSLTFLSICSISLVLLYVAFVYSMSVTFPYICSFSLYVLHVALVCSMSVTLHPFAKSEHLRNQ